MFVLGLVIVALVAGPAMARMMAPSQTKDPGMPDIIRDRECIPNYAHCTDIGRTEPCCRQQELRIGQTIPEDFICFRFGIGKCQPLSSVDKLEPYAQLMKSANETNIFKLRAQYYLHKIFEKNTTVVEDLKM
ncbi:cysteine motif gene-c19.1 [Ichnoviriform fugitivi]|uniref:Cysteine motif gene-c19.1 n=1 Tax=Ichnoviriform fugitivi TaxID=265522 RepID=A2Q0I8_9VIRU|nr:cysteine motif gene-c19.1 [Ichnoviriform fugitivi]BAF45703.1 cysteine motif gene-c19.1 [Ichnoviriform fugitivi]